MFNNKNIDRLFQEKFKNFEQQPNPEIWTGIENKLEAKNTNRRRFLIAKLAIFIASIGLLFGIGNWYNEHNNNNEDKDKVVTRKNNLNRSPKEISLVKTVDNNTVIHNKSNTVKAATKKQPIKNYSKKTLLKNSYNKKRNTLLKNHVSNTTLTVNEPILITNQKAPFISNTSAKRAFISALNTSEIRDVEITSFQLKMPSIKINIRNYVKPIENDIATSSEKWAVGPSVSPIYFGSLTKGSPIDKQIANSEKSGSISYSYGLKVSYKLTKKWSLQSGINDLDLSYRTKDIKMVTEIPVTYNFPQANINSDTNNNNHISIFPKENDGSISPYFGTATIIPGDIKQDLSYTEIPLEVKYTLLGKNLQLSMRGGFSTLFLNDNNITLENNINSLNIGKATNLNNLNFTANLGLDIDFKVSENWNMNFAPAFKYHLNTFSHNSGGFRPYSLGLYTGLNYKF